MKVIVTVLVVLSVAALGSLVVVMMGWYDVSALRHHGRLFEWAAETAVDNAVRRQAREIAVPPLNDRGQIATGFLHYHEMCVECHGAPGVLPSEIGQGLYPKPPDLQEAVKDWTPAELYWIIKNGFKDTGMPAFAPTHSEQDLWAMTSFALRLPTMKPAQYDSLLAAAGMTKRGDERGE